MKNKELVGKTKDPDTQSDVYIQRRLGCVGRKVFLEFKENTH